MVFYFLVNNSYDLRMMLDLYNPGSVIILAIHKQPDSKILASRTRASCCDAREPS